MDSHQLINQTSGDVEYYTPRSIVKAARLVMGSIDLDPASSAAANKHANAAIFFDENINGLSREWCGNVWMNHPFGRAESICGPNCDKTGCIKRGWHRTTAAYGNAAWANKFVQEYMEGRMQQGCCITFACTSETWFQPLLKLPQCFLSPRTNYYLPGGSILKGVTKGSVVTYAGPNVKAFYYYFQEFGAFGVVKVPYSTPPHHGKLYI